jgi:hypothetical protein
MLEITAHSKCKNISYAFILLHFRNKLFFFSLEVDLIHERSFSLIVPFCMSLIAQSVQ